MDAAHLAAQRRHLLRTQLAVRPGMPVEAVVGHALRIHGDQAQGRGGRIERDQVAGRHSLVLQHLTQLQAEKIGGDPGQQGGVHPQPAEPHRHVEGGAAGNRLEAYLTGQFTVRWLDEQVEQRFAAY